MTAKWNLVGSHGTVLFYLASHTEATIHETAQVLDLTERRVMQVVHDLADADLISIEKRGRRNVYRINTEAPFRNPVREVRLGEVVKLIQDERVASA